MKTICILFLLLPLYTIAQSNSKWKNVDADFGPLPASVHVYYTDQAIDTAPFKAYYLVAQLNDKKLDFTTDTTLNRRLTAQGFYSKNGDPLVVVNGTFFSFETNRNLNLVIKDGELISYNQQSIKGRGKDTLTFRHAFASAIGIDKKRRPDVAWTITDSSERNPFASQLSMDALKDSVDHHDMDSFIRATSIVSNSSPSPLFMKWKMETAIGGGPVLVQNNQVKVTNNEELKFAGKAINDKHPRTAMGYTKDGQLIILVIEGRNPTARGATLIQEAQILKDLGCVEALNLDGGGSSCLLINGKETIKPSDSQGQRAVPAVFIIKNK
jgi:hypothetical protein